MVYINVENPLVLENLENSGLGLTILFCYFGVNFVFFRVKNVLKKAQKLQKIVEKLTKMIYKLFFELMWSVYMDISFGFIA